MAHLRNYKASDAALRCPERHMAFKLIVHISHPRSSHPVHAEWCPNGGDWDEPPLHRIRYFKYDGVVIWDRVNRIDLLFHSAGEVAGQCWCEVPT